MNLTSDQVVLWHYGFVKLNDTMVTTWAMMIADGAWARSWSPAGSRPKVRSRVGRAGSRLWSVALKSRFKDVGLDQPAKYISFLGTLFPVRRDLQPVHVIPGFTPPTGSLSTTAALALCVFVAVPLFGIEEQGLAGYLKTYTKPTIIMLPFNIISEALAHAGAGGSSLRQHDERRDDRRHSAYHYALPLSHRHDRARPAHRYGASLYFQHFGRGLHRSCHAISQTEVRSKGPVEPVEPGTLAMKRIPHG